MGDQPVRSGATHAGADARSSRRSSNRAGWQSGNALALQLSGVGRREAETFDDNPQRAAVLQVEFIAATVQDVAACMPADLNPNLDDNPVPSDVDLQLDCEHRVQETLSGLAGACGYPSQLRVQAVPNSRGFNAACNDPCVETPLARGLHQLRSERRHDHGDQRARRRAGLPRAARPELDRPAADGAPHLRHGQPLRG